jgi:hypothetical protein
MFVEYLKVKLITYVVLLFSPWLFSSPFPSCSSGLCGENLRRAVIQQLLEEPKLKGLKLRKAPLFAQDILCTFNRIHALLIRAGCLLKLC